MVGERRRVHQYPPTADPNNESNWTFYCLESFHFWQKSHTKRLLIIKNCHVLLTLSDLLVKFYKLVNIVFLFQDIIPIDILYVINLNFIRDLAYNFFVIEDLKFIFAEF